MLSPADKIYFWSGIMRDHAEFFLLTLSFRESQMIQNAQYYKSTFNEIHHKARNNEPQILAKSVVPILKKFTDYKLLALKKLMQCNIELGLPPTFVNHMINEALEFMRDLNQLLSGDKPNPLDENILLHKVWLPDAAGHAASIASDLDPTEIPWILQANEFKRSFENLYFKATELGLELERAGLRDGALEWFNMEVTIKINEFIGFLDKVRELREKCKLLGSLKPLIPDHMIREEKYYLANLESL